MVFHRNLSDSKSPQVSRTLLSILADLNSAVVWMVSSRLLISKSSSPRTSLLVNVRSVPITIDITSLSCSTVFRFNSKVNVFISVFAFFQFYLVVSRGCKVPNSAHLLCLLTITRSGRLGEIRWSVWISKSEKILCVSFSWTDSGLCIYHLFVWLDFNILRNFLWITFPTQSCLVLYSFCANFLHSIIWHWSFRLYQLVMYICYFVASYLFLLWHNWSLWRCFVLLLEEIQFLS